jgi:formate dehydrogenase subunit delta
MHERAAHLVKMANDIGTFFASQSPSEPAAAVQGAAAHLKLFWSPSMRKLLLDTYDAGEAEDLAPIIQSAIKAHRTTLVRTNSHVPAEEEFIFPAGGGDAG